MSTVSRHAAAVEALCVSRWWRAPMVTGRRPWWRWHREAECALAVVIAAIFLAGCGVIGKSDSGLRASEVPVTFVYRRDDHDRGAPARDADPVERLQLGPRVWFGDRSPGLLPPPRRHDPDRR